MARIKRVQISHSPEDTGAFARTQVSYQGKTKKTEVIYPYGSAGRPPKDCLGIALPVNDTEEDLPIIAYSPNLRPKNFKEGEYAVGNFLTGQLINFLENGVMTIGGSDYGGVIKISDLTTKLNALVSTFNAHKHTETGSQTSTPIATAATFNKADYENLKITHGSVGKGGSSGGSGGATTNKHSLLTQLDYASSGHIGFEPTLAKGNLTGSVNRVSVSGGGGAVIGVGAIIDIDVNLLPSPVLADAGKALIATGANAATWQTLPSGMVYPAAGLALSTGSAWDTSVVNNSANWNTAYGWGNHAGLYDLLGAASGAIATHEGTYNHSLIATALQSISGQAHDLLAGLTDDDHSQYLLLAGRAGGQAVVGGTLTTQGLSFRANAADLTSAGVSFLDTMDASSSTTGAATFAGGVGIGKKLYVAGNISGAVIYASGLIQTLSEYQRVSTVNGVRNGLSFYDQPAVPAIGDGHRIDWYIKLGSTNQMYSSIVSRVNNVGVGTCGGDLKIALYDNGSYSDYLYLGLQKAVIYKKTGINVASPSAWLNLPAGTATANESPLKFTSGVNLTTPEAGAIEYDGSFWATISTASRYKIPLIAGTDYQAPLTAGSDYEVPLTFSAPLSRAINTISMPVATALADGYLSSADWTDFDTAYGWGNHASAGYIKTIVEDTGPKLGGDLDTNSNDIKFKDNDKAIFGTGLDAEIYSDGDNLIVRGLTSNKKIKFYGNFGGVDTEVMTIDMLTKNVGFGDTDPSARATFVSGGAGSVPFRILDGATMTPLVDMAQGGSGNANLVFNSITGKCGVLLGGTLQTQLNNGVSVGWRFREGATSAKTASVVGTGIENITPSTYGSECLTNGALTSGTSWTSSGDATLTADTAVFAYSAGTASYISQAAASLATALKANTWYAFTHTVSAATANKAGYPQITIQTNSGGQLAVFSGNNGTKTIYFKTNASAISYFRLNCTLSAGQACTLDDLSLTEITSGGLYTGGGANGLYVGQNGNMGFGAITTPTAQAHFGAGTATANTAPIKLTSGTLNTTPEIGALEFLTDKLYGVITTGAARKEFTLNDIALTSGRVPYATTNGRLTDVANFTHDGTTLTATNYYGSMYADDITRSVVISSAGVYYEVGGSLSGGSVNGFTFQNNKELKCNVAGKYLVNWSISSQSASANQYIEGAVMVNGTAQANTVNATQIGTANKDYTCGGTGIITLAVNDLVSLCMENETGTNNLTVTHANLTLHRVGA
jgi:hypothetical protein